MTPRRLWAQSLLPLFFLNTAADGSTPLDSAAASQWFLPIQAPYPVYNYVLQDEAGFVGWGVNLSSVQQGWTPDSINTDPAMHFGMQAVYAPSPRDAIDPHGDDYPTRQIFSDAEYYGNETAEEAFWMPVAPIWSNGLLFYGPNANLTTARTISVNSTITTENTTWIGAPFALTLGGANSNGSIVFGGGYDWARVNDTQWHKLPGNGSSMFVENGSFVWNDPSVRVGNPANNGTQRIVLDLNNPGIQLPSNVDVGGAACNGTVNVTMAGAIMDIDVAILRAGPRGPAPCDESSSPTGSIGLGYPFLQSAYLYFDSDGSTYVARALTTNSKPDIRPFDADATIESHPEAEYTPAPQKSMTSHLHIGLIQALAVAVPVAWGLVC